MTRSRTGPFLRGLLGATLLSLPSTVAISASAAAPQPASAKVTGLPKGAAAPGTKFRECAECPEMVVIPAGSFVMGSPQTEDERDSDEGPQRKVTFAKPFALAAYPVTKQDYAVFIRETGRSAGYGCDGFNAEGKWGSIVSAYWRHPNYEQTPRDPVVCVTWEDAQAYAQWINAKLGSADPARQGPYRLVSEAEFEYALRGGTTSMRYWGDAPREEYSNSGRDPCCDGWAAGDDKWINTSPVGSFPPNPFGLYDMAGNVWEWTADCYHDSYAGAPTDGSAQTADPCRLRSLRGGSWMSFGHWYRSAKRVKYPPDTRSQLNGFRLARNLG